MDPVRWGILSVSGHYALRVHQPLSRMSEARIVAIASRGAAEGRRGRRPLRHPEELRLLRRAHRRPRGRGGLHPPAQQPPRRVGDRGAQGRQARALREALRDGRRPGEDHGGRRQGEGPPPHGSLHVSLPPAVAEGARDRRVGRAGAAARDPVLVLVQQRRPGEYTQPPRDRRRRPLRHRLLRRIERPLPRDAPAPRRRRRLARAEARPLHRRARRRISAPTSSARASSTSGPP